MNGIERITLKKVVFGIRFDNHFRIEDALGEIVDDILSTDTHGPDRFQNIGYGPGVRQLFREDRTETISFNRNDTIYENTSAKCSVRELPSLANGFLDVVWSAVCENTDAPNINRYGCLVGFDLPNEWDPIRTLLDTESNDHSEFDLRFSHRILVPKALATRDVNDYRNVIYELTRKTGKTAATIDFQHYYSPSLDDEKSRKENPYMAFIEKATSHFQGTGWEFLRSHVERIQRAAA